MKLIDTHSHLYAEEFDGDRDQAMLRAEQAGVERLLLPAIDSQSHAAMLSLCSRYPGRCYPMMGLHPTSVNDNPRWREELAAVEGHLANPPAGGFYAVGEIGLDFYWSRDFMAEQEEVFRRQIELALNYGLPIVVHTRDAWDQMATLISSYRGRGLRGVFHAFSGTEEHYRVLRSSGDFAFGIGGVVTFKKSPLAQIVQQMALEDIVLETDCPYLTPVPHRGQRNESAYIPYICIKVAELKELTEHDVATATTANAERMFGLKSKN